MSIRCRIPAKYNTDHNNDDFSIEKIYNIIILIWVS